MKSLGSIPQGFLDVRINILYQLLCQTQLAFHSVLCHNTGTSLSQSAVVVEANISDTRAYAEEPLKTRIQTFMETLAVQKSGN